VLTQRGLLSLAALLCGILTAGCSAASHADLVGRWTSPGDLDSYILEPGGVGYFRSLNNNGQALDLPARWSLEDDQLRFEFGLPGVSDTTLLLELRGEHLEQTSFGKVWIFTRHDL
jgi:hypothetical protein